MLKSCFVAGVSLLALTVAAHAEGTDTLNDVLVLGQRPAAKLDQPSGTASRLGLTVRETPASTEVLTQEDLQVRGLRTSREAFDDVVGAISGNVPGNPAVVTLRGFSGGAVSILQDGVRVSTSTMVTRDTNTWHYDRIEVIKGPASVLYGEGALAGVINKVTRKPTLDGDHGEAMVSYGSFNTVTAAAGVNVQLSDDVAIRADGSHMRSDSLYDVDHNRTRSDGLTGSLLYKPRQDLSVLLAVDHYSDRYDGTYQGVPLVARATARDPSDAVSTSNGMVIDKALRTKNYNPDGAYSGADETTVRSRIDYTLGDGWSLANDLMWYTATRDFVLSGDQNYTAPTAAFPNGSFARSVQRIYHDQQFWNERLALANQGEIAGLRNRFTVGGEYNHTNFVDPRQQSAVGAIAAVDPYNPVLGSFPTAASVYKSTNVVYDSKLTTTAAFVEDALNLTPSWLLVAGGRYDHISLERGVTDLNAGGAFSSSNPNYGPVSWRAGTTYDLTPAVTLYSQYTTAVTPVSSVLTQSLANTKYRLTTGRAVEAGVKATVLDGRASLTGAVYRITQSNILTRDPNNPSQSVQGGQQESKGVEMMVDAAVTRQLHLSAGYSYTDAKYTALSELISGVRVDRTGNRPINTPDNTVNASALYSFDALPVTLGAFVRHAGGFYTDTANSIHVQGHWVLDASVSYKLTPDMTLTVRGRNLTDAFYGEYSGYPTTNVYIGAPRSGEISLSAKF
ncbi:iron complex outermembrane receptor protein [Nitrospirillum amazonense]|uniref:Iron complex outermembrane receptor protein n=1 Tax=Nitrospirillum amazonense TaxID=28077 RepID=A0A560FP55_9PROT|nr:TonB-dependent receptor [Nitrospirillum amazonense]TWB23399.1 iron complex outermembrane receptor protein [Nitrospirillum amazonense]